MLTWMRNLTIRAKVTLSFAIICVTTIGLGVFAIERMGKKRLAYEIDDVREGNYVVMQFKSDGAASKELERLLKLHEDVLRALVVRLDEKMIRHMAAKWS